MTGENYKGALYSYLRVLVVAIASALSPMFVGAEDFPTGKAVLIAAIASLLLVTVNFFGSWETRYGTPPNPGAVDEGYALLSLLGAVLAVVGVVLLLIAAVEASALSVPGLVLLAVGVVIYAFDRNGVR